MLLGVASLVLLVVLGIIDQEMQDTGGPGIIPFEVAGTQERAEEIRADWGSDGRSAARWSLILDYPYLVTYALFFSLAAATLGATLGRRGLGSLAAAGGLVAWAALGAGAFDALENAALHVVLSGDGGDAAPALALVFASLKFLLSGLTILFLVVGLVMLAVRRRPSTI